MINDELDVTMDQAMRLAGVQTTKYTRSLIFKLTDAVNKKKGALTILDISKIDCEICEELGLDTKTKEPISHENRKIYIVKLGSGGNHFIDKDGKFTDDHEKAWDYKSFEFAERMIIEHEYKGVTIIPYYE